MKHLLRVNVCVLMLMVLVFGLTDLVQGSVNVGVGGVVASTLSLGIVRGAWTNDIDTDLPPKLRG